MIVSINQPAYLPWLGYFQRIAASDLHIVLDHVQFEKNSFTNRNRIKTPQGGAWLTVPVRTKGQFGQLAINTLTINNLTPWRKKHWQSIRTNYTRAPHFAEHADFFENILAQEWEYLGELCREITNYLLRAFEIDTPLEYSSELGIGGTKSELVLNLCRARKADLYLSGALGKDYLEEETFQKEGIQVVYQDYRHPEYPQLHGDFLSYMAAIDLLFNCGPNSKSILMNQQDRIPE